MSKILIIDDDKMLCDALSRLVERMGHESEYALTLESGLNLVLSEVFDVVFLDVKLPDGNGVNIIPKIRETPSDPEVIIITGTGDPDGAELAIRNGAWDYIQKTSSINEMMLQLSRALDYREKKIVSPQPVALKARQIIGKNSKLLACLDLVAQASVSDVAILVTGETGTGKELIARAIHDNSNRMGESFVTVDCTALPESLVESLLLGHERGAFTGAERAQEGLIRQAHLGTLFLDEIGELPPETQKNFLRVLEEKRFRPIGGKNEVSSDFRLVAATNRDLEKMAEQGAFRRDLLFRLRSLTIELPPLRERMDDLPELTMYYVAKVCRQYGKETKGFSTDFFEALTSHNWPGNIRELFNILEGAISLAGDDPTLYFKHLPTQFRAQLKRSSIIKPQTQDDKQTNLPQTAESLPPLREFRESMEKHYLEDLISVTKRDMKSACRISGLSRSHLYELLKKHNILSPE